VSWGSPRVRRVLKRSGLRKAWNWKTKSNGKKGGINGFVGGDFTTVKNGNMEKHRRDPPDPKSGSDSWESAVP